jgi:hypothetical protein
VSGGRKVLAKVAERQKLSSQGNHNQETKLPKLKKDAKAPLGGFGGKKGTGRKTYFLISLN